MKKINLCMKTYDYKDETKDVKGKVRNTRHWLLAPLRRQQAKVAHCTRSRLSFELFLEIRLLGQATTSN